MQIILGWMVEALILALFELLVLGIGYGIARVMLPVLSLDKIRVEPLCGPAVSFNLFGTRRDGGRIEIASTTAGFLGLLIGLFACFAIMVLIRAVA
jgi:hypothetical protein